jgi:uncharacterized protein (DUF1697 family)
MTTFVALLRAVNVGGTGKLAMSDLCMDCETAGFRGAKTYLQSGNVVFKSALPEAKVKAKLENALAIRIGKPCAVMIRTGPELEAVLQRNPFRKASPSQVLILFMEEAPAPGAFAGVIIPGREQVKLDGREVFVHYPNGMGRSKLKLPWARSSTGRNLNTVAKLATMALDMEKAKPERPRRRPPPRP